MRGRRAFAENGRAADYQKRRDRLCAPLVEIGFDLEPPAGGYYVMADASAFLSDRPDDLAFARRLAREVGVAAVPGSSFFRRKDLGRRFVRFCFCERDETLDIAIDRLRRPRALA